MRSHTKNRILTECEDDLRCCTEKYDWQTSNLIFASFFGICIIGGLLMRPLGTNRPFLGPSTWARICKRFRSPGIDSASLCGLAGWQDKYGYPTGSPGYICWRNRFLESIPRLLKRLQICAQIAIPTLPIFLKHTFTRLFHDKVYIFTIISINKYQKGDEGRYRWKR